MDRWRDGEFNVGWVAEGFLWLGSDRRDRVVADGWGSVVATFELRLPMPDLRSGAPIGSKPRHTIVMAKDSSLLDRLRRILGDKAEPVDPPPPPTPSTDVNPARHAVLLVRGALPIPDGDPTRSYIGGLPRLPAHFEWPTETPFDEPRALTFVAQIDLSELPSFPERELLPAAGTLYFFASSEFDGGDDPPGHVLYFDGDATTLPFAVPPDNLMLLAGNLYYYSRFWLDEEHDPHAKIEFRYPLSFVVSESYPEDEIGKQLDAWQTALGASSNHDLSARYRLISPEDPAWPFNWACVEHVAAAARCKIEREPDSLKALSAEEAARVSTVVSEATEWVTRRRARDAFAAPSSAEAQEFRAWWQAQRATLRTISRQYKLHHFDSERAFRAGVDHAVRLSCAAGDAARGLIPAHYLECVQTETLWQRSTMPGDRSVNMPMHQMFGYGERVQNAAADHADDVLLLQIKGDPGLAWNENTGCALQLWIGRDALQRLQLDEVVTTVECD